MTMNRDQLVDVLIAVGREEMALSGKMYHDDHTGAYEVFYFVSPTSTGYQPSFAVRVIYIDITAVDPAFVHRRQFDINQESVANLADLKCQIEEHILNDPVF